MGFREISRIFREMVGTGRRRRVDSRRGFRNIYMEGVGEIFSILVMGIELRLS